MKISTKGRYALRIMLDLAQQNTDDYVSVKDISERQGITIKYMEQIISQLCKMKFLKSLRGHGGGYKLSKSPECYTVSDILRGVEGSLAPVACLEDSPNQCDRCAGCLTLPLWEGLNKLVQGYFDSITLADLLLRNEKTDVAP